MSRTVNILARLFPKIARLVEEKRDLRERLKIAKAQRDKAKARREKLEEELETIRAWLPERPRKDGPTYRLDGLSTSHTPAFEDDPEFLEAYEAGVQAAGEDYGWQWRVHSALWFAREALSVPGDFVEFGAGKGFLCAAIQRYLDWESQTRVFWMFDTFCGLVESQISDAERAVGRYAGEKGRFRECFDEVNAVFGKRQRVHLVRGIIPDTLPQLTAERIAFCSIDMNCAEPEIAAGHFIWERLSPGAIVVLDDYANDGYEPQRIAWDEFARDHGFKILSLPNGQGAWRKPTL